MSFSIPGLRLIQGIGTGARSRIYLAVDVKDGTRFAVKRVVRNGPDDDRYVEQAENEHTVASRIDHRSIRKSYDVHRVRKLLQLRELYLVMEYVAGVGLDRSMPNRLLSFLNLFIRVAEGLHAMHLAGFLHTDIKPNNILLGQGLVKIIDLGQACPIGHRKERIQGTPDYIAPEQVERGVLNQRTDVFNLGATMYYVLTLRTFPTQVRGADVRGGIAIVDTDGPLAPMEINDKIPLALSNLVMDCCRTDPLQRPADMMHVIHRLTAVKDQWKKHREAFRRQVRKGGDGRATQAQTAMDTGSDDDEEAFDSATTSE